MTKLQQTNDRLRAANRTLREKLKQLEAKHAENPTRPKYLSEKCAVLVLNAIKQVGSFRPDEVLPVIEESLTGNEYATLEGFLNWVLTAKMTFGTANINVVYREFLKSKPCAVRDRPAITNH